LTRPCCPSVPGDVDACHSGDRLPSVAALLDAAGRPAGAAEQVGELLLGDPAASAVVVGASRGERATAGARPCSATVYGFPQRLRRSTITASGARCRHGVRRLMRMRRGWSTTRQSEWQRHSGHITHRDSLVSCIIVNA
jgi:hypothetical protein